jgi:hypothetical protein
MKFDRFDHQIFLVGEKQFWSVTKTFIQLITFFSYFSKNLIAISR